MSSLCFPNPLAFRGFTAIISTVPSFKQGKGPHEKNEDGVVDVDVSVDLRFTSRGSTRRCNHKPVFVHELLTAMKTPAIATALILLVGTLSGLSQPSPLASTQILVSEIAREFTNYQQITKSVVLVNPALAMLCRGASKEDVEAARIKFGPHANTGILIYMNKVAADAFATNASIFPVGAVVVKQKKIFGYIDKDGKQVRGADTGVGGMVKRPVGYDPKHGDWEYFYFEDVTKIESGRISTCVECHSSAKDRDYVFGTWRKAGG